MAERAAPARPGALAAGLVRPVLAWTLGAACLLPLVYLVVLSFVAAWPFPALVPEALSAEAWRRLLTGTGALARSFGLSVGVSTAVAGLATAAGFATGKYVGYHPRRDALLLVAYVPFVMSPVILGTCLMYLYLKAGLAGTVAGVVAAQSMFAYGFAIVFFSAFWTDEVRALEGLVHTLGGTRRQAYRRVLVPLAGPMLLICFFQTFLISWFQYGLTLLIGAGKVQTLPLLVYAYVNEANVYYAALASCLLVLPPVLLLWANKRFLFGDSPVPAH